MHQAAKMCTQGAGCNLNFEHFILPIAVIRPMEHVSNVM